VRSLQLFKAASLFGGVCSEDIGWRASRGLDRHFVTALAGVDWVRHALSILIASASGTGKTWLSCARARQAARSGFTVLNARATWPLQDFRVGHANGRFSCGRRNRHASTCCCWATSLARRRKRASARLKLRSS
jgi:hypothetical protein